MVNRPREIDELRRLLRTFPIVGILGARQVGKTTLARMVVKRLGQLAAYFDLENPVDAARLADPMLALSSLKGIVVIDEIQRRPGLFPVLRVLADRTGRTTRFLVLGSASPALVRHSSETLAGRIAYHTLAGFSLDEIGATHAERLWVRGGFPNSYLARSAGDSLLWRRNFVRTFLERDIPLLGINIRSETLQRFWSMLAHYHGQTWNSSDFARSFGVADTTIRSYLDILTGTFMVRQLLPWHENISKRQVKAPKVYIADSGILHLLLNLQSLNDIEGHPKVGASWEGFIVDQALRRLQAQPEECFYWATHAGAELDLFVIRGKKRIGVEVKRTVSPSVTPSMRIALHDLKLSRLYVVHAGEETFPLQKRITAVAARRLLSDISPLR
jgi:predicted AAA+ superfamily ATPase